MKTKLIIALLLTLFIFRLPPLARAQEDDLSAEIARAVEKAVNEKIEILRAELRAELKNELLSNLSRLHFYSLAEIDYFDRKAQTVNLSVRFMDTENGKPIIRLRSCEKVPILVPSEAEVYKNETCLVFFSNPLDIGIESKRDIFNQDKSKKKDISDVLAIGGFSPRNPLPRNYKIESILLPSDFNNLQNDVSKHHRILNELINNTLRDMLGGTHSNSLISSELTTIQRKLNE